MSLSLKLPRESVRSIISLRAGWGNSERIELNPHALRGHTAPCAPPKYCKPAFAVRSVPCMRYAVVLTQRKTWLDPRPNFNPRQRNDLLGRSGFGASHPGSAQPENFVKVSEGLTKIAGNHSLRKRNTLIK